MTSPLTRPDRPAGPTAPDVHDAAGDPTRASLSALADGDAQALASACAAWRDDEQARATWHAYHLIGDVLRSDDLASTPARDQAFLAALRTRLAEEPVVLAPAPLPARAAAARQRWLTPAAVVAGFALVAGVLVVSRVSAPGVDDTGAPAMASGPAPEPALALVGTRPSASAPGRVEGVLIRDAQLDLYLRAHRDAHGGAAAAVPGGVPRNVDTLTTSAR